MSMFNELKRRNVFRVGIAYVLIAWLFLQAADFGLDLIDAPNWVIQALFLLAAIGLPAVLVFSWVFEMTPEGLKREEDVTRDASITPQTGQKLNRVIITVLSLVIVVMLLERFLDRPALTEATVGDQVAQAPASAGADPNGERARPADAASIAVLPFANMSNDPDNEYFSDGLTETLLHMLAQLPELRVAARTSSFAFKGSDAGIDEIATTLNVAHVLEGSVQKAGERVRVTAQLIRADDGFHVWSQNYTRPLEDIFAIQDEIATDVARALDSSLLGGNEILHGVETRNLTAYETYLRALEQQALFTYGSLPAADSLFKEALALDPGFLEAKIGLARNQLKMATTGILDRDQAWAQSQPLLTQVLQQDPGNASARVIQRVYDIWFTNPIGQEERQAGVDDLLTLLPLAPTESFARSTTAKIAFLMQNDPDTALALLDAGLLTDPLDADLLVTKGQILVELDRLDEAEPYLLRALEYRPGDANNHFVMAALSAKRGDPAAQLDWMRRATEVDPQDHELAADIAVMLFDLGLVEEGDRWARRVFSQAAQSPVGRKVALLQAEAHGEHARALQLAQGMIDDDVSTRQSSLIEAIFRYAELMARAGRAEEGMAYFESVRPQAMRDDVLDLPVADAMFQFAAGHWLPLMYDKEEVVNRWSHTIRMLDTSLPSWRNNPKSLLLSAALEGRTDEALRIAQEDVFTLPPSEKLSIDTLFATPALAQLASLPEVQAGLAQQQRQKEALRGEVRELLLQPEWNE